MCVEEELAALAPVQLAQHLSQHRSLDSVRHELHDIGVEVERLLRVVVRAAQSACCSQAGLRSRELPGLADGDLVDPGVGARPFEVDVEAKQELLPGEGTSVIDERLVEAADPEADRAAQLIGVAAVEAGDLGTAVELDGHGMPPRVGVTEAGSPRRGVRLLALGR